jgi:signal peptide peptidase SppA
VSESLKNLAAAQFWAMERMNLMALMRAAAEIDLSERIREFAKDDPARGANLESGVLPGKAAAQETDVYALADVEIVDGIAIVPIRGTIVKEVPAMWRACACEACGMIELQAALRALSFDGSVKRVLLAIDSPGGTISGVAEAADTIRGVRAEKPVHAAISDLGAWAAYWLASQADTIAANVTAHVGSIGVYTWAVDSHRAYESAGFDVHLIASGPEKGAGLEGTKITNEQLASVRENVLAMADIFASEVASGRDFTAAEIAAVRGGRTWIAPQARGLGLIDFVETFAETLARVSA